MPEDGICRYLKVHWVHDHPDEPIVFYHEVGDDDWEIRKVEVFPDGRMGLASADLKVNGSFQSETSFPTIEEIAKETDIYPYSITREEFERIWARAISQPEISPSDEGEASPL